MGAAVVRQKSDSVDARTILVPAVIAPHAARTRWVILIRHHGRRTGGALHDAVSSNL